jgi:hypothetical protein
MPRTKTSVVNQPDKEKEATRKKRVELSIKAAVYLNRMQAHSEQIAPKNVLVDAYYTPAVLWFLGVTDLVNCASLDKGGHRCLRDFMEKHLVRLDTEYEAILQQRDSVFRELTAVRTPHQFEAYEQKYNELPSAPRCVHHRQMEKFYLKRDPLLGRDVLLEMLEPFADRSQDEVEEVLQAKSAMRRLYFGTFAPKRERPIFQNCVNGGDIVVCYYDALKRLFEQPQKPSKRK